MFDLTQKGDSLRVDFSSELRHVDRVIAESLVFLEQYAIADGSNFKLVLREMLNNAVEHGNNSQVEKKVSCLITALGKRRLKIEVADEGKGFNYRELDLKLPEDPKQIRNRGFSLINAFSDGMTFNETGNKITVFITFSEETDFELQENEDFHEITPSGSLTAAISEKFQGLLQQLYELGVRNYRFDFRNVEDIDSICLSVLILLSKTLARDEREYHLEIVHAAKDLQTLFQMTRMDEIYLVKV